jgi:hypothetical protein
MSYFRNATSASGTAIEYYCEQYQEFLQKILDHPEIFGLTLGTDTLDVSSQVLDGTVTESTINDLLISDDYTV